MNSFFIRALTITPFLVGLALAIKHYLVEPYGVSVVEFDVEFKVYRALKGDKDI